MKYLFILKRFEIWLLLAVVGFVFYSAFRPEPPEDDNELPQEDTIAVVDGPQTEDLPKPDEAEPTKEDETNFAVESVRIHADSDAGRIVEITLLARSDTGNEVILDEKTLRAETETGAAVPRFFAPFQETQRVDAEEASLVTVRFWLEQPAEKLNLFFEGQQAEAFLAAKEA